MKKIVVANWKMNGSIAYLRALKVFFEEVGTDFLKTRVVICPQASYISMCCDLLPVAIEVGAQDCATHESGAFTGSISAAALKDCGATFVIIGHSERRTLFKESLDDINKKIEQAQNAGLTPIVCVGEPLDSRKKGEEKSFVGEQLLSALQVLKGDYYIAYEPIWSIGTGLTASKEDIDSMCTFIKDNTMKENVLYGGSVTPSNVQEIFDVKSAAGVLVGGACLKLETFSPLIS